MLEDRTQKYYLVRTDTRMRQSWHMMTPEKASESNKWLELQSNTLKWIHWSEWDEIAREPLYPTI